MKNFTYYEAEKFLKEVAQGQDLDIDNFDLSEFSNAKEVSKLLDVSESTANNWLAGRTDISKLGEQAIGYQLMINMVEAYKNTPKSNILVKNDDGYVIYREKSDGEYEFFAKTNDIKLARTIKEINKVYKLLVLCERFVSEELKIREDYFSAEELQPYNIELTNLRDVIAYIAQGKSISQKREEMLNEDLPPIDLQSNTTKDNKNEDILELKKEASDDLVNDKKKLPDICIPKGALLRYKPNTTRNPYTNYKGIVLYVKKIENGKYLTYKAEKNGIEWTDYKDYFGENNLGKEYKSLRSAFEAILYTKSKSLNETEETEYSTNDGKTWRPTNELKMTDEEVNDVIANKLAKELGI